MKLPRITLLVLVVMNLFMAAASAQSVTFGNGAFAATWNRVDKPVQDIPQLGRGYIWGPPVLGSEKITTEPYNADSRQVQYFDKSRIEINNPAGNPADLFFVTNGLLVQEMVTGYRQDSDTTFTYFSPSQQQVAGDPNDNGANQVAPTYASFGNYIMRQRSYNPSPKTPGSVITARIDRAGNITQFNPPQQVTNSAYDDITHRNIASVFVDYTAREGLIWNGQAFAQGNLFYDNPVYVIGRPLAEAYWTRAVVAGVEKDVLVQLFERRVLTYTPSNPSAYQVEMGNVGQHYFKWRYQTYPAYVGETDRLTSGLIKPYKVAVDPQGYVYTAGESGVQKFDGQGHFVSKLNTTIKEPNALAVDGNGNLYVTEMRSNTVYKFNRDGQPQKQWTTRTGNYTQGEYPVGIAAGPDGNIYVVCHYNLVSQAGASAIAVIEKFDAEGHLIKEIETGKIFASGIAVDGQSNIYITSFGSSPITKIDASGTLLEDLADFNTYDGNITMGNFADITVDNHGSLWVVSSNNGRVYKFDKAGNLLLAWGSQGQGEGQFDHPNAIALDSQGNLYIADTGNNRVQKFGQTDKIS